MSDQKTIVLGVTGCIAAYKACEILRGFQKRGFDVWVVMTENAREFIAPATFEALTGHPVVTTLFGVPDIPIPHIELASKADALVIAPCTANVIAKLAHGIADDALTSTVLACTCPVIIAPAMNVHMFKNPRTQANLRILRADGLSVIGPVSGRLACGDEGEGKLEEVEVIVSESLAILEKPQDMAGLQVVITAGPTREPIDPVRYISNHSSGKMGFAIAHECARRGAQVTLVSGPVQISVPQDCRVIPVITAREMHAAALEAFESSDIAICTAAVCDMRATRISEAKLKKNDEGVAFSSLDFVPNPDILADMGAMKRNGQTVIGFAAETDDLIRHAQEKLERKGADMIVANDVSGGAVFNADENTVHLVTRENVVDLPCMSKSLVAKALMDAIMSRRALS